MSGESQLRADIVEVAPIYDGPGQITSVLAANLMFEVLCTMARSAGVKPHSS